MFAPPDELRQRCVDLSAAIKQGDALSARNSALHWLSARNPEHASQLEPQIEAWWQTAADALEASERVGLENIRSQASEPTWQEAWDVVTGRRENSWTDPRGNTVEVVQTRITRYFMRMLDYIKSVRLHIFPKSALPDDFQLRFAERFRKMSDYIIDGLFRDLGCLIDWWVPPRKPTGRKSIDRVLGWLDGLNLYLPNEIVQRVDEVYTAYRQYKKFPADLPRDDIQVELSTLQQPATTPLLASYHLHPTVEQTAARFWAIGEYDTALFKVCVALDNAVQAKSGNQADGVTLMNTVFSEHKPLLKIQPRFGNQKGFMFLFAGAMDAIRNPRAHHEQANLTREEALEWLIFLSALFRVLDATSR